jgi:hypothetical protein
MMHAHITTFYKHNHYHILRVYAPVTALYSAEPLNSSPSHQHLLSLRNSSTGVQTGSICTQQGMQPLVPPARSKQRTLQHVVLPACIWHFGG